MSMFIYKSRILDKDVECDIDSLMYELGTKSDLTLKEIIPFGFGSFNLGCQKTFVDKEFLYKIVCYIELLNKRVEALAENVNCFKKTEEMLFNDREALKEENERMKEEIDALNKKISELTEGKEEKLKPDSELFKNFGISETDANLILMLSKIFNVDDQTIKDTVTRVFGNNEKEEEETSSDDFWKNFLKHNDERLFRFLFPNEPKL